MWHFATRSQQIIFASSIGIAANLLLACGKAAAGFATGSIAIVLDAVNNLSDVLSSLVTIIGTHLAEKPADKEHPLGHGRIEYLTATVIAVLVLYAGIAAFAESIKKIITPSTPEYSLLPLAFIAAAVIIKIILGRYAQSVGRHVNSAALLDSGTDAIFDAWISAATLAAGFVFSLWQIRLEAFLGTIISLIIIKSGIAMLRRTISQILGERAGSELSLGIKKTICAFEQVQGAYDLILHDYGPNTIIGSVHIEVRDTMTAVEIDELSRIIQKSVHEKYGVTLTGIGIYSINTNNPQACEVRAAIEKLLLSRQHILQMHGFYVNLEAKQINFDIIIDFAAENRIDVYNEITQEVQRMYPDFTLGITMDTDISD